ncbi:MULTISPECIES: GNAT family N-acetyltransferase [unclassified Sporosarcina]|uniref:GNAT family N-acetyltransferase n=1 Tax=unclassified Sporosarcina TaxID=2647733 RepID=UPI0020421615|nr:MULTISPECIES: GNAT family N-acetyltransferase [unclassified Sporosarcina]GKV66178.1 GNAT family N-acetyltransferase [Sporosarcina sp. NCCP-2331]GLB56214.1 GNAT family N-acetyltransferase [Sporosarcina sp. NCCP-2378]
MKQAIEIGMLPVDAGANTVDVEHITKIVNRVYAASEIGLWKDGAARITTAEVAEYIGNGEVAAAWSNGQIVGCIRVYRMSEGTAEFGMLAVDDACQGAGIGRKLIQFVEEEFKEKDFFYMQLELLVPEQGLHEVKEGLRQWYTRLGYQKAYMETMEASFPQLVPMLAVPCEIHVYQKKLVY